MTTDPTTEYPPVMRRSQALELAGRYGITEYTFRILLAKGASGRARLCGVRDHYKRDVLIEVFSQQKPLPPPSSGSL